MPITRTTATAFITLIITPRVKLTDTSLEFVMGFTAANSHFQNYENPFSIIYRRASDTKFSVYPKRFKVPEISLP
jgi:hypothetical protein